jgi:hypothetical protein
MNFESDKGIKVNGACEKKWAAPLMVVPFTECSNVNGAVSNQGHVNCLFLGQYLILNS